MNRFCEMGDGCEGQPGGEVRLLPYSSDPHYGMVLCRSCYEQQIQYRRERNQELDPDATWDQNIYACPKWTDLQIYKPL